MLNLNPGHVYLVVDANINLSLPSVDDAVQGPKRLVVLAHDQEQGQRLLLQM